MYDILKKLNVQISENAPPRLKLNDSETSSLLYDVDFQLLKAAVQLVIESKQASVSLLQRRLRLDYTSSSKLIDVMEQLGAIGQFNGSSPRAVYIRPLIELTPQPSVQLTEPEQDIISAENTSKSPIQRKKTTWGMFMSLLDIFKLKKLKNTVTSLQSENAELKSLLQPEHYELLDLKKEIASSISEKEKIEYNTQTANSILLTLTTQYEAERQKLLVIEEQLLLESFAHYEPKYELQNSSNYKIKLDSIRIQQKDMIKAGTACTGNMGWTVNNNASQGKKMVNDMIKLVLRSFNNECDVCVSNVKFNNIETHEKRINSSYDALEKLGKIMQVSISFEYKKLKFEELYLAHEFQLKKQEEKEEQKQIREQIREEAKLQKEIEETRKTVDKEKKHYSNALDKAKKQLEACDSMEERISIQEKIDELNLNLIEIDRQLKDIDYREANQRAGYVYVISNIGAFGENIFKIGMTRRLDPYDRVNELSDASVPFNFDVHAMIFSDDAPKLENALHNMFEDRKVNAINSRREFFRVSLDEIEEVIKNNHDKTVEFIKTAEAEQYRESLLIRQRKSAAIFEIEQAYKEAAVTVEN